jgi:hypothetical protein
VPVSVTDRDLTALQLDLLRGFQPRCLPELGPDPSYAAFQQHQLLSIRFVRASLTNAVGRDLSLTSAWRAFFAEHFPRGDEHADRLLKHWRNTLCKDEFPGSGVVISHGQPKPHWTITQPGSRLYINFESMCLDHFKAIESLIQALVDDHPRRKATIAWWHERRWTVQQIDYPVMATASAAGSAVADLSQNPLLTERLRDLFSARAFE